MREVRVYDRAFPTGEQKLSAGIEAARPKEIWLEQMQPGEFAVRYKNFKTRFASGPAGEYLGSLEVCRIFPNIEEARADSKTVVKEHWTVRCVIFDQSGAQVGTISNNKELSKFAAVAYAGMIFWIAAFTLAGMAMIWLAYAILQLVLGSSHAVLRQPLTTGWLYWAKFACAGLPLAVFAWYVRFRFTMSRKASLMKRKVNAAISPEDKKRFAALDGLVRSKDPADRQRYLDLSREYSEKIREALKK